ncbi:hypothetical protein GYB22_09880, partial [bacterium]|nr:hypothetical protein [bacterium]
PKGGELNWFNRTTPNMPDEIKNIAYSLEENGDYSKPIQTRYGWHIIKLVDQKEIASFEMVREALRRKVERDSRSELNKAVVVARVKKENNYVDRNKLSEIQPFFDSTLLDGKWKQPKDAVKDLVLFTIADQEYTSEDFYNYVIKHQSKSPKNIAASLKDLYLEFVNDENMKYEEAHLEEKYDDFKYIMQEYKDGILLFELTNKEVWSKAVEDTLGLEQYYNAHKSEYMYPERVDAQIFSCVDAKTAKKARKMAKKGKSVNEILDALNTEDALAVTVNAMKFEPGVNDDIDSLPKEAGIYEIPEANNRIKFVRILEILPPETKPLEKNLGQATSDYQNELESLWLEELRAKYPIQVFEENVQRLYN